MNTKRGAAEKSIQNYLWIGGIAFLVLVAGIGGLAAVTSISGAVIAPGVFVVDSSVKKIQHPTGGIVGSLNVRDGDRVLAGDLLVRLDDTQTRSNLEIVTGRLDEFSARRARLVAERDDREQPAFPVDLLRNRSRPEIAQLIDSETRLFGLRRVAREGQRAQLTSRIEQLGKQIAGLHLQEEARQKEIALNQTQLDGVRNLWKKQLVSIDRLTATERDAARLTGERGQLLASIAEAEGRISEFELQILQVDQEMRSEVASSLREVEAQEAEDLERKVAAEDQLRRVDLRAPQSGVVHQLSVHTIGGVIAPGEMIMLIVPSNDSLTIDAHVAPQDIDQIFAGQTALLRLSAFSQRTTPEIFGRVDKVPADQVQDQKTGQSFYLVRIRVDQAELARLENLTILPGMPAEVFLKTKERNMLSYLVKPLSDQIERAFRED